LSASEEILISGTSAGLGTALAKHYCALGQRVIGLSRRPATFQSDTYRHEQIDISDDEEITKLFQGFREEKESIKLMIHCAAVSHSSLALLTSGAVARNLAEINIVGSFLLLRESIKHMKRSGDGRIVCLSSMNVPTASAGSSVYNASKAALENLAHTLSNETQDTSITINCLGLSIYDEGGMAQELDKAALVEKSRHANRSISVSLEEIVHAIDFFASDMAASITNQTIYFSGVK
tara:strand:+ start:1797 stop:2504 length:708 start_codon:yes stop_codon:yes gene_type:complete